MSGAFPWPDAAIGAVLVLAAFKGFARGFVKEVGGFIALAALLVAPRYYNGSMDSTIDGYTKLGPVASHVAGMLLTGAFAYVAVIAVAFLLDRIARLPVLGIGNALAGGAVGFVKGAILVWVVLFVALFFPLTPAIRTSLRGSRLAPYFVAPDYIAIAAVEATLPDFARPFVEPYVDRHHL
ncbi:MAG TPA: CvpA family protein [Candidatus Acidoferrales bacterium]|nr:CvpA family protein [Candidatus Acidoferrales bacterium]